MKCSGEYSIRKKELALDIENLALSNLDYVGSIDNIKGKVIFNERGFRPMTLPAPS